MHYAYYALCILCIMHIMHYAHYALCTLFIMHIMITITDCDYGLQIMIMDYNYGLKQCGNIDLIRFFIFEKITVNKAEFVQHQVSFVYKAHL